MKVSVDRLYEDFPYYAEHLLKIQTKDNDLRPFILNAAQALVWDEIKRLRAEGRPPRIVILKSRQLGFTTLGQGLLCWDAHRRARVQNLMLAHKTEAAQNILRMNKRFLDNMPDAPDGAAHGFPWRPEVVNRSKNELRFAHDSSIEVAVAGEGGGRSYTSTGVHMSEFAFYDDAEGTFTAVMQAVPDTVESLVIVESTPNGWGNAFHQLWLNARSGESEFVPVFIPWFWDKNYRRKPAIPTERWSDEERELAARVGLDGNQIAWRRYCLNTKCNSDRDIFDQEYGEDEHRTFLSSGRRVIEADHVQHYQEQADAYRLNTDATRPSEIVATTDPRRPRIEVIDNGRLTVLRAPKPRHLYAAGVDISSGDKGSDPCDIVILNRHTLDVDAIWHGRQPPEMLAVTACSLAWHYNEAMMNPEANADGAMFIYRTLEIGYPNLYMRRTSEDTVAKRVTDKVGYYTSAANKKHIVNCVREWARTRAGRCESQILVSQFSSAVYDDKDSPVWPESNLKDSRRHHGDAFIALGLALIAHKTVPDETLAPLAFHDIARAADAVATMRGMRSSGRMESEVAQMIEAGFGLSLEEMEELDERLEKRARKERRSFNREAAL